MWIIFVVHMHTTWYCSTQTSCSISFQFWFCCQSACVTTTFLRGTPNHPLILYNTSYITSSYIIPVIAPNLYLYHSSYITINCLGTQQFWLSAQKFHYMLPYSCAIINVFKTISGMCLLCKPSQSPKYSIWDNYTTTYIYPCACTGGVEYWNTLWSVHTPQVSVTHTASSS